ncbi:MAG: tetratricopeptide repeat protein, partial [Calditrichae bacterium]|nr:tetratricopeptide repeat protein [Calditrichia bacterium]
MYHSKSLIFCILTVSFISCAYYNTLFNAQARYADGIRKIEESKEKKITSDIRNDFQAAIDKCWKLINIYSDSSKYADDALLIIGKSHYHIEEYVKAERFLSQFVNRYRDSDLVAEAYLWLGMSLIELDRNDEALAHLNKVLAEDESDDLNARAYLNSGRVYLKRENYEQARKQFAEVFNLTGDDEIQGNAQFLTAETYYQESNYTESTVSFERVLEYDASVDLLFRAILRKVDSYLNLEEYDQVIITLESISSETRFLHKKSVVLALIGDCYKVQGKFLEANEIYYDVLETYPRT